MKSHSPKSISSINKELKSLNGYNSVTTEKIPAKIFNSVVMWNSIEYLKCDDKNVSFNFKYINLLLQNRGLGDESDQLIIIDFNKDKSINKVICLNGSIFDNLEQLQFTPKFPPYLIEQNKITVFCNTEYQEVIKCGENVGIYNPYQLAKVIRSLKLHKRLKCVEKIKTAQHYHKLVEDMYPHIQYPKSTAPLRRY